MGNEPSKKSSGRYRSGEGASKSTKNGGLSSLSSPMEALWRICAPVASPVDNASQQTDSVDLNQIVSSESSGKQKTGRSSYHGGTTRTKQNRATPSVTDKSDKSIKTSIKNVQKDVSMKSADQRKKVVPTEDSAHTFAASQSTSQFRKGNDYVMITDALSDVRVK